MDKVMIMIGCVMFGMLCMQARAYGRYVKKRRSGSQTAEPAISDEDRKRYAGKHVLIDMNERKVVASADTVEEMYCNCTDLRGKKVDHIVYAYIPRPGEVRFGDTWYRPVRRI